MNKSQEYRVDVVELKKIMVEQKLDKIIDLSAASTVDRNTLSKVINGDAKPSTTVKELGQPPKYALDIVSYFPELARMADDYLDRLESLGT